MPTRQDRYLPPNPLLSYDVLEAKRREAAQARRRTIAAIDLAARPRLPPPPPVPTPIEARAGREVRRPTPSFTGEYPGPSPVPRPRPALPPAISKQGVQPGIAEGVTPVLRGVGQIVRGTGETLQRFLKRVLGLKPGPLPPPTSIPQAIGRGLPALIGILEREFTAEELAQEPFYQQALTAIPAGAWVGPEFRAAGALAKEAFPQAQLAAKAIGREVVTTPAAREKLLKAAMPLRMAEEGRLGPLKPRKLTKPEYVNMLDMQRRIREGRLPERERPKLDRLEARHNAWLAVQKAPKPVAPAPAAAARQPWEMTVSEYKQTVVPTLKGKELLRAAFTQDGMGRPAAHRFSIVKALSEGKPVPPEVLADYPDLAARVAPRAEVPLAAYPSEVRERVLQLDGAITEGEMRLRTKRNSIGEKLSQLELIAVQKAVKNSKVEKAKLLASAAKPPSPIAAGPPAAKPDLDKALRDFGAAQAAQRQQEIVVKGKAAYIREGLKEAEKEAKAIGFPLDKAVQRRELERQFEKLAAAPPARAAEVSGFTDIFGKPIDPEPHARFLADQLRQLPEERWDPFLDFAVSAKTQPQLNAYVKARAKDLARSTAPRAAEPPPLAAAEAAQPAIPTQAETAIPSAPAKAAPPPAAAVPPVEPPKPPITVPPGPPSGEPFAANIRLSKFPEELRSAIKDWADAHPNLVQEARRGVRSDAQVLEDARALVNEVGGDFAKLQKRWKPGEAWNAEEITAIRGTLADATRKVMQRQQAIKAGADTAENLLALQQALLEHAQTQTIVHGITAEAGRSLRAFRQTITEVLASGNALKIQQILERIGKRADLEEVARKLGQLDIENPAQVATFIRSMVKPKAMDYVVEWYINSLLSGPTTHMVNAISNAVMVTTLPARTTLAAGIDIGLAALQRRPQERFFAEVPAQVISAFQGVSEGARAAVHTMRYGIRPLSPSKYELPRIKAFSGLLGKAVNLPSNAMEAMDAFFYHINFRAAFNAEAVRLARRQPEAGISFAERVVAIKQNPPERLIARADEIAEEMLFRAEPGSFTQAIMGLRDKTLLGIPVGRFFIPFVRTPANILIQGFQYSPLGVMNPKLWRSLAAKNPEAADLLAKSVLGTAVAVALTTYFAKGRITGPAPTNPAERDRFYRLGKLPWAIRVGDTWVQYRRMEPFNMPLTLIAGVIEAVEKGNDKDALSKAGAAISTLGRNFFDQTYMTGLADLMDALEDPDRWGSRLARRFGLSFLPYSRAQAQLSASISPTYKAPETFLEQAKSQIPGLAAGVSPKLTIFGEEIKRTSPAWWPIAYSPAKEDFLNSELERLQINIGFAGKTIAGRKLSAFEQQQYQEVSGKFAKGALLLLITRSGYTRLSDANKEKVIRRVTDMAREQSRQFLSGETTGPQVEQDVTNYIRTTLLPPIPTMRRLRVRRRGIRERGRRRITIQ